MTSAGFGSGAGDLQMQRDTMNRVFLKKATNISAAKDSLQKLVASRSGARMAGEKQQAGSDEQSLEATTNAFHYMLAYSDGDMPRQAKRL